jgi:transglutaminase-like putative cysteine protease
MRLRIRHMTSFHYEEAARAAFTELRLTPRNDESQNLLRFTLTIDPPARTTSYRDHFGALVYAFNIWAPHHDLSIVAESEVVTYPGPALPEEAGDLDALDDPQLIDDQAEWLSPSARASGGEQLTAFAEHIKEVVRPTSVLALVRGARSEVHRRFAYLSGSSYVSSTVDDLLERGSGVCQDFAHLSIATLRELGVPARYVSGYFYAGPMPPLPDQTVDVVSHAWVEALVPGTGWVGLDPTNDCPPDERHVTVAVGRDYSDVAPVSGVMHGGAGQILEVSVTMVTPSLPLDSTPGAGRRPGPRELPGGDQQ